MSCLSLILFHMFTFEIRICCSHPLLCFPSVAVHPHFSELELSSGGIFVYYLTNEHLHVALPGHRGLHSPLIA